MRCADRCVNPAVDASNCGACGTACPDATVCINRVCVPTTCARGQVRCGGCCVDLLDHPMHCGACSRCCGVGQVCVQGDCRSAP